MGSFKFKIFDNQKLIEKFLTFLLKNKKNSLRWAFFSKKIKILQFLESENQPN